MIRRLKYNEIDFVRYQKVLSEACQVDDFASREFMDIVAGKNWGILVYRDYEAVMPIAWSSNFGIKIIQMPPLCHQLGVFSEEDNPQVNQDFSNFLKKNFAISYYAFNKDNAFPTGSRNKKSYVILKDRYEDVKKKYHVHRRRNIRHTEDIKGNAEFISNVNPDEIEDFFLENARGLPSRSLKKVYWKIVSRLIETGFLEAFAVKYKGNLHSFVATFNAGQTDYLSIFINASQLENKNIPSLAIDYKLQHAIEHKNFDFMGSNVPNVASFNERFGAQPYFFSVLNYQKLNIISKIIKLAFTKNR
ncbi:hypothetical protein [Chryseobacterium pennipullorum]|uniref:GNAT family N-acetyltransferase n=1 Tax=Chryseobacterium pennipullorum TaxID=2258963 RepID=A0A3D9AXQ8_9FLAO|nr:hypothetical protein [Chryseobacterium pennipullorum]REC46135.1 hypothetical protein DRF67_15380 [Chryseobacterium pennipullorum]